MTPSSIWSAPALRVTLLASSLFAANGVALPFLSRWLEDARGLHGVQIGLVLSMPQIFRLVIAPAVGFWGDGCADRRTPLRVLASAATCAFLAFFLVPGGFPALFVVGFIALTMLQSIFPFVEAALMRAGRTGPIPYGLARGAASIAFVMANIVGGVLISRFGPHATEVWVVAMLALCIFVAFQLLPYDPSPPAASRDLRTRFAGALTLMRHRRYLLCILSAGLVQAAHGFFYGFSALAWKAQGLSADIVGLLWAAGVIIEIAFLWSLPLFERHVRPEHYILAGAGGAVVRWALLGFSPPLAALWPLQALHALSFAATHVGAMRLIFHETPEETHGLAQTLSSGLAGGVLIGAATLLSGALYDAMGARGYWIMAAIAACGGLIALGFLAPAPVRRAR